MNQVHLQLTSKRADTPAVARETAVCGRRLPSETCACSPTVRFRRSAGAGVEVAGIVLQIAAPKCAICWATYAGLVNASWFAAENVNPLWLACATLTLILSLAAGLQRALQTRRFTALLGTTVAWVLLVAGWLTDIAPVRCAGFGLLSTSYAIGLWFDCKSCAPASGASNASFQVCRMTLPEEVERPLSDPFLPVS